MLEVTVDFVCRCLELLTGYHQTHTAQRLQHMICNKTEFCVLCFIEQQNKEMITLHLCSEHKVTCSSCGHTGQLCSENNLRDCDNTQVEVGDNEDSKVESNCGFKLHKPLFKCKPCCLVFPTKAAIATHKVKYHGPAKCDKQNQKIKAKSNHCHEEFNVIDTNITYNLFDDSTSDFEDDFGNCLNKNGSSLNIGAVGTNLDVETTKHRSVYSTNLRSKVEGMDVKLINRAKKEINGTIVYQCEFCNKNLTNRKGYVRHIRIHTGEQPYVCHICGNQFKIRKELTVHIKHVHERVRNYFCDVCDSSFSTKSNRDTHRRIHFPDRPFVCDICGKCFPTQGYLYTHRRIHTNHFPYQCSTCGKMWRTKQTLILHTRVHTGEKPYRCEVCGRCFRVKKDLDNHTFIHTKEKNYACSVCSARFSQQRYATKHMKRHHPLDG